MQRNGTPADVTTTVLFILDSDYVTGETIIVDGGRHVRQVTPARAPQRYGTIVVVGGGCYGSYYVRQLERAVERRAPSTIERIVVVDRDPGCAVAAALAARSEAPAVHIDLDVARLARVL